MTIHYYSGSIVSYLALPNLTTPQSYASIIDSASSVNLSSLLPADIELQLGRLLTLSVL
jgi:hypothetical protein